MEIRLANAEDLAAILQYDRHIPLEQDADEIMYLKEMTK